LVLDRKGDWFKVGYNGRFGYIDGHYLRPRIPKERGNMFTHMVSVPLKYFFPEKTFIMKVIGFLLTLPVSVIVSLILIKILGQNSYIRIGFRIYLEDLTFIIPMLYMIIKNGLFFNYPMSEMSIILMGLIAIGYLVDYPSSRIVEAIIDKL
jgi:hypothetical protein